ncbi:MAG: hypothetical protein HY423_02065 [Candidatus Lambdaproteobacteria bacterium]|nr:hypothetical protein [Candidatus Lambdaproteobacteria bacterium]
MSPQDYERYFTQIQSQDFERRVSEAAERAVLEMDRLVANEVKLRYVTHVFSKTLDDIADWLIRPKLVN